LRPQTRSFASPRVERGVALTIPLDLHTSHMHIGILGTGMVGQTIGTRLTQLGHDVKMGSRDAGNEKARKWVMQTGPRASHGTFADAAAFGAMLFNCCSGDGSLAALKSAGEKNMNGKVLVDVANPLNMSKIPLPELTVCNDDSLGERIQREFPNVKVVKSLNTMNCQLMVDAKKVPGEHDVFVCGNDPEAKSTVKEILREFGWDNPVDLGDISASRGTEMLLPVWLRLMVTLKTPMFNFHIAR
jgi:8-hydroxy-5-deazaflavin:NADPH oxidoreductase